MNILVSCFVYNEKKYLPYFVDYYKKQGCDLLILDNYSNDGTYEWLLNNNIKTGRVDTDGSFHLWKLQSALISEIKNISPDWVMYMGADMFYFFNDPIIETIKKAEKEGYNVISTGGYRALNTGESFNLPLYKNYFYVRNERNSQLICKFGKGFRIYVDSVKISNRNILVSDGFFIDYGMCKPKNEREETLKRRQKAWDEGLKPYWGAHYTSSSKINWTWNRKTLTDIRKLNVWKLVSNNLIIQ